MNDQAKPTNLAAGNKVSSPSSMCKDKGNTDKTLLGMTQGDFKPVSYLYYFFPLIYIMFRYIVK